MIHRILAAVFCMFSTTACITISGGNLPPIEIDPGEVSPSVEYTVGDFEFTLEGGKMVTSNKAGKILSDEIFKIWKKKGYISGFDYVEGGAFTEGAQHRLTLSGSQYGDSSVVAQIFSGLTLFILPYTVDTKYDVQYSYEDLQTGKVCSAEVADSYNTIIELLLFLALPVSGRGQQKTMEAMGDHVYSQLQRDCNFGAAPAAVRRNRSTLTWQLAKRDGISVPESRSPIELVSIMPRGYGSVSAGSPVPGTAVQ